MDDLESKKKNYFWRANPYTNINPPMDPMMENLTLAHRPVGLSGQVGDRRLLETCDKMNAG